MEEKSARHKKQSYNDRAENRFQHPGSRKRREPGQVRNNVVQVPVAIVDHRIVVPGLTGPEPNPTRPTDKRANDDQENPLEETGAKHPERNPALLDRVVAISQRVRVNIGKDHQTDHDQAGHHHAGNPRIEVDEHLLQPQEVPGRFRGIHRQVWIGRFFERRVERD